MGIMSWRCAKTTKGIPVQRNQITEVIVMLPDNSRVSGFFGDESDIIAAERVDRNGQPLPEHENFHELSTQNVFALYAPYLTPAPKPGPDDTFAMADIDRLFEVIKIVRADEIAPEDTYEALGVSEIDPWQGIDYDTDQQWKLPLAEALALDSEDEYDRPGMN